MHSHRYLPKAVSKTWRWQRAEIGVFQWNSQLQLCEFHWDTPVSACCHLQGLITVCGRCLGLCTRHRHQFLYKEQCTHTSSAHSCCAGCLRFMLHHAVASSREHCAHTAVFVSSWAMPAWELLTLYRDIGYGCSNTGCRTLSATHWHCDMHVQESVTIHLAAITNENVYSTQAMDALLYIRVGDELTAGAEQNMAHDMLSLHIACRNRF